MQLLDIARMDVPLVRSKDSWAHEEPPESVRRAQEAIGGADHLVIFYPLWLGTMPALLKAFLEQVLRPGFALGSSGSAKTWRGLLAGKSARVVVTMGMPAFVYRWYFRAHSLKSLERNVLNFCGIGPVAETLVGMVEALDERRRRRWLAKMRRLGAARR